MAYMPTPEELELEIERQKEIFAEQNYENPNVFESAKKKPGKGRK